MARSAYRPKNNKQILTIDLYDCDKRLIAREGEEVDLKLFRRVAKQGARYQRQMVSLNKPEILKTVKQVMREKIYQHMFQPSSLQKKILQIAKKTKIQKALYREIYRLKKNSNFTYRHFVLMAVLSARMTMDLKSYGYKPEEAFIYGLVHDIGKAKLPFRTLNKKTPLTSNEYRILHSYPNFSILLLYYYMGFTNHSKEAIRVAYEHHEKIDGSGYPKGIKRLSKYTKVIAIIDIFDALVSKRPYRKRGFTVRGALDKLITQLYAGKLPKLAIRLLISYFRKGKHNFRTMKISIRAREEDPEGNSYGKIARSK